MLTVVETETGAWAVVDAAGRRVWSSPFLGVACLRAAVALADRAAVERWP